MASSRFKRVDLSCQNLVEGVRRKGFNGTPYDRAIGVLKLKSGPNAAVDLPAACRIIAKAGGANLLSKMSCVATQ